MYDDSFIKDLGVGRKFEDEFSSYYRKRYNVTTTQKQGKCDTHDVEIEFEDGEKMTVECKWDRMAHLTGNHAVEIYKKYEGDDEIYPGGLSATEADVYAFGFEGFPQVYGIETYKLLEMVEKNKHFKVMDYTGQGNATIALFKLDWFLKQCELLYTRD